VKEVLNDVAAESATQEQWDGSKEQNKDDLDFKAMAVG
jgi:hypothetical protein